MRRADRSKRIWLWGVAATVFAAAFLLAPAGFSQGEPIIDTAGPVVKDQCAPCHVDLGNVDVDGLIFSHGNHLLVSCEACHARMPHRAGETERVPMEACFTCHGIQHGPQGELATGECADCHTPSFDLRPSTHVEKWAEKPHAVASDESGVNNCMMCHYAPADCDSCHVAESVDVGPMPDVYHSLVEPRPKGPSVKIYPRGEVTMSQCVYCHAAVDTVDDGRLIFGHDDHLRRNYPCAACHPVFPHRETGTDKPDMMSCYRCHGVQHAAQGAVATEDCIACHPVGFELMPDDHTDPFIKGTHADRAASEPAYCMMCHKPDFCVGCHRGELTSPNAPGVEVIPTGHRQAEWLGKHGGDFLNAQGACGACHDDPSCKRCHQTVMPHPVGWIENHTPAPGIPGDDCNVCHTNRSSCQNCHHAQVRRAQLTAENCVPCHDEMSQTPATSIKHKGFAEHAAHFNVAESKGNPYTCDDCHIGFATAGSGHVNGNGNGGLPAAGHDVRLCYSCHGSLNFRNEIIAPWPGAQLCIRCHTDLNV